MFTQQIIKQDITVVLEQLGLVGLDKQEVHDTQEVPHKQEVQWIVERTDSPAFGDFSSNAAMQLFRLLSDENKKKFSQPRMFAQALVEKIQRNNDTKKRYTKIEVAGPGFINFFVSSRQLLSDFMQMLDALSSGSVELVSSEFAGKKVLVEFTDPNPFKELHIGHAYSNIVGESIARLYEVAGAQVLRVCYQGDVGMHVAKSVWGMKQLLVEEQKQISDIASLPLSQRIAFLGKSYAKGATAYEEDESAKQEMKEINFATYAAAQRRLVADEGWEPQVDYAQFLKNSAVNQEEIDSYYQQGRAWSLEYFDTQYARLGTKFDDFFFESLVGEYGIQIVREFLEKGVFKESQGAVIFPGSEYGLHDRVFINSLGLPTYEAKELGLAPEKYRRHQYDHSVIVTANEIKEYFKVLLTAMTQTHPELAAKTRHLSHGMVRLPEGKMSSRTGKVITAQWLLDEAQAKMMEKVTGSQPNWDSKKQIEAARAISVGAVKYAFLKQSIGQDIAFSFEDSLSFTGQSGPYLQYTYVRCDSILQKLVVNDSEQAVLLKQTNILTAQGIEDLTDKNSLDVIKVLLQYPAVLQQSLVEYSPHHLALYLFELSQAFSVFYDTTPILHETDQSIKVQRVAVVVALQTVLKHGMNILGLEAIKEM
jgi:arginyl-tRNA synthetase